MYGKQSNESLTINSSVKVPHLHSKTGRNEIALLCADQGSVVNVSVTLERLDTALNELELG